MKKLYFILVILVSQLGFAQIDDEDALIFFADKENVQTSIDNPLTILTQDALDRKALHNIPIDERDVPVNEDYIAQVKSASSNIVVFAKSKWLNCVYVRGPMAEVKDLTLLPFVTNIEWMDKGLNFPQPGSGDDKFAIENTRINYDYGIAANQIEMIRGDFLHEQNFTGEGMVIAVMDSGFPNFETNPGFSNIMNEGRLLGTYDFYNRTTTISATSTHGIKTTSDIGGFIDGDFVGTAPNASFYLFRTEFAGDETPREEAWWVEALERADSLGVDVVNTSLGYQYYGDYNPNYTHTYEDLDGVTTVAARGANIATEKGMLLVTSAGNQGNTFGTVGTPADAIGILSIGAVDSDGDYADFSSRGPTVDGRIKPDVMAQGRSSAVIDQNGNLDFSSGTSFSSPIMAGAVACLWQSRPEVLNLDVMQIVRESAHLFDSPTNQMGYGIPNFEDAYNALQVLGNEQDFLKQNFAVYPNPVQDQLHISFPEEISQASVQVYNVLGEKVIDIQVNAQSGILDFSNLVSGVYIANITAENTRNSFKIVKQ